MSVMRLIIVSNRLPFTASMTEAGPQFTSSSGGLATGLASYLARASCQEAKTVDYIWFGWPGATISPEHQDLVKERGLAEFKVSPLFLAEESMQKFYHGFCNKTIWPLFHYFSSLAEYDENCWQEYREVNRLFADKLAEELRPGDIVGCMTTNSCSCLNCCGTAFQMSLSAFSFTFPFPPSSCSACCPLTGGAN